VEGVGEVSNQGDRCRACRQILERLCTGFHTLETRRNPYQYVFNPYPLLWIEIYEGMGMGSIFSTWGLPVPFPV